MGILAFLAALVGVGKDAGLIKSPEDEVKLQQAALAAAAQKDSAFAQFITATSPTNNPVWVNAVISLIRPTVTWAAMFLIVASVYNPAVALAIKTAGINPQWLFFFPAWWFVGRSAEKIMGTNIFGNGT